MKKTRLNHRPSFLYSRIILTFLYVSCILTCFSCQASPPQSCRSWRQHESQPHRHLPPSSWESYWLLFQYTSQVSLQVTVWHWTYYLFSLYLSFSSNYHTQICKPSNYKQIKRGQKRYTRLYGHAHGKTWLLCILLSLTHPWGQMDSMWRTQIWWSFLPQSWHSTNGSNSRWSFFISLNWSFFIALELHPQHILVQINLRGDSLATGPKQIWEKYSKIWSKRIQVCLDVKGDQFQHRLWAGPVLHRSRYVYINFQVIISIT